MHTAGHFSECKGTLFEGHIGQQVKGDLAMPNVHVAPLQYHPFLSQGSSWISHSALHTGDDESVETILRRSPMLSQAQKKHCLPRHTPKVLPNATRCRVAFLEYSMSTLCLVSMGFCTCVAISTADLPFVTGLQNASWPRVPEAADGQQSVGVGRPNV